MSQFKCPLLELERVEKHPDADALELAYFADYASVCALGQFKVGDKVVYFPEFALLPEDIVETLGLKGKLTGVDKNRITAIRLRGVLSQGIFIGFDRVLGILEKRKYFNSETCSYDHIANSWKLGQDFAEILGIKKYEPIIPSELNGAVIHVEGVRFHYDLEDLKGYPNVLTDGEEVIVTEKIHGTLCSIGYVPGLNHPDMFEDGCGVVFSKSLGQKGFMFTNSEENTTNRYCEMAKKVLPILKEYSEKRKESVFLFGEIFGANVQDLTYGLKGQKFQMFDIYVGQPGKGDYLNFDEKVALAKEIGIEMVPILYKGPYSKEAISEFTEGKTTIEGNACIREGIVITANPNRRDKTLGRVILKSKNPEYLLRGYRKGYVATEFS